MIPACLECIRVDVRTLLISVCGYAMIFSYPLEPGYGKQYGDHEDQTRPGDQKDIQTTHLQPTSALSRVYFVQHNRP